MYKRIINFLLIFLVFVYIIFEELIWDKFAKPIISYISNFSLFKNLTPKILALNSYIILIIFIIPFFLVELLGVYAGFVFISGHIILGTFLYLLKIPIAALIFWYFNTTKERLLEFVWFKYIYEKLVLFINKIKNSKAYSLIKENFFISKSRLKEKIVRIYKLLKSKFVK
ncbi:hypothetical protein [Aliarcobacter butzleri]|uniref:Bll5565 protein n=1 Tax=Aliarcobacter butzleri TaxID=28197 RepID=A0AAW7PSR0_9BACT|nr:hypothetical protein [Aliarcobacter butzleri]MDN5064459.1 hypothetical protein [Aliarcobacter butzleri]MDN5066531.1 hypothetical protein [Aliarcobacter butzleri]